MLVDRGRDIKRVQNRRHIDEQRRVSEVSPGTDPKSAIELNGGTESIIWNNAPSTETKNDRGGIHASGIRMTGLEVPLWNELLWFRIRLRILEDRPETQSVTETPTRLSASHTRRSAGLRFPLE